MRRYRLPEAWIAPDKSCLPMAGPRWGPPGHARATALELKWPPTSPGSA